ncbi:uncharacterized protein Dana_GF26989 [Drosophila ananassae]|uniref:Uncharacterized protein n=1 Tax=Drosophila ananassae TaxID=7217 RepID=A0A0P8XYH1_DROAN|nr:uncharacterized protein Dana_GF26989 [Drosophila ananassae]
MTADKDTHLTQGLRHHIHQHHQPNSPFRFKSSQKTESLLNSENIHHNITYPDAISQMQHHAFWVIKGHSWGTDSRDKCPHIPSTRMF